MMVASMMVVAVATRAVVIAVRDTNLDIFGLCQATSDSIPCMLAGTIGLLFLWK